jgi:hypothetical protein
MPVPFTLPRPHVFRSCFAFVFPFVFPLVDARAPVPDRAGLRARAYQIVPDFATECWARCARPDRPTWGGIAGETEFSASTGRAALHLQKRGHELVAIDVSPGAIEVCPRRGVDDPRLLAVEDFGPSLGIFDTILMLGGNLGLLGSRARARTLLRRFRRLTSETGRIVGTTRDPYATDERVHLDYHRRNRERGRMAGQVRIRVRYRARATPWFDYLLMAPGELDELADEAGWRIHRLIHGTSSYYAAVLEKQ